MSALEQAAEVQAEVVGKPTRSFFEACLKSLEVDGIAPADWKDVAMVSRFSALAALTGEFKCDASTVMVRANLMIAIVHPLDRRRLEKRSGRRGRRAGT